MVRLQKEAEKQGERNDGTRRNRLFESICGAKRKETLHSVE